VRREAATVAGLLDDATARIAAALGLAHRDARLDARVLAAHVLGVDTAWLIAHDTDPLSDTHTAAFEFLLTQRLEGVPVAYLVGTREFYGRPFQVSPDVLIPRPDTELLVELALARMPPDQAMDVLDLGTGSGCIAITLALERSRARITAVDRSAAALAIAERNADILNAHVEFLTCDWFAALVGRRFDLIVGNPPYIAATDPHLARGDVRFEPLTALTAGRDGLADLPTDRRCAQSPQARRRPAAGTRLRPGGRRPGPVAREWHPPPPELGRPGGHPARQRRRTVGIIYTRRVRGAARNRCKHYAMVIPGRLKVYWGDSCCKYWDSIQTIIEACHVRPHTRNARHPARGIARRFGRPIPSPADRRRAEGFSDFHAGQPPGMGQPVQHFRDGFR
jgi:release factor glutamine methyltransferase